MSTFRILLRPGAVFTLAIVLTACGGTTQTDNSGGGTIAVIDGIAEINADDLEFDAATITAPAGEPFTVVFVNMEGVPHNFSVYEEEGGELIAEGTVISEGETDEVEIQGLSAGEYFFVCDVHAAEMTGTLVVEG